jgi:hypothetical protein
MHYTETATAPMKSSTTQHLLKRNAKVDVDHFGGSAVEHDVVWVPVTDANYVSNDVCYSYTPHKR